MKYFHNFICDYVVLKADCDVKKNTLTYYTFINSFQLRIARQSIAQYAVTHSPPSLTTKTFVTFR